MSNDDSWPEGYKYVWRAGSDIPLNDFLTKFKPSMVQNDGTKPWIWVEGSGRQEPSKDDSEAVKEATNLLKEVTKKVEGIKNDDSIPVRSNKKTGAKSKKEIREQVQAEATERLKELSLKHDFVSGKWLIFAPADRVDQIWSGIVSSLVSGPLHDTSADFAKVSTSSEAENPNAIAQHIICVYLPNVYDTESVTEVMKILLRNHGVNLSGVKSDLYTKIGIDSKHPSGIPSTVWKNTSILPEKDIKELKDAYFAELASNKPGAAPSNGGSSEMSTKTLGPAKSQAKLKLKKKVEDPFVSDDESEAKNGENSSSNKVTALESSKAKAKPKLKKKADLNPFASDGDDDDAAKDTKKTLTKSTKTGGKRPQSDLGEGSDNEEGIGPKKKILKK